MIINLSPVGGFLTNEDNVHTLQTLVNRATSPICATLALQKASSTTPATQQSSRSGINL